MIMSDKVYVRAHFRGRSKQTPRKREADIEYYMKIIDNSFESLENKRIAVNELKRLEARKELMKIVTNPWTNDLIKKQAREALESI